MQKNPGHFPKIYQLSAKTTIVSNIRKCQRIYSTQNGDYADLINKGFRVSLWSNATKTAQFATLAQTFNLIQHVL